MPVWLEILLGAIPGLAGLIAAFMGFGRIHQQVENLGHKVEGLPRMAEDIAYLKGRLEGADIERLSYSPARTRTRKVALAANNGG